jgi:hypothetical protein
MGCRRIFVDPGHAGIDSAKGQQVLRGIEADRPLPDTTSFNYERGLA